MLIGCWNPSGWKAYFAQRSSAVAWGRAQHFGSKFGSKSIEKCDIIASLCSGETSYATEIWYIHLHYIDRERETLVPYWLWQGSCGWHLLANPAASPKFTKRCSFWASKNGTQRLSANGI